MLKKRTLNSELKKAKRMKLPRLEMFKKKILNDEILLWPFSMGIFLVAYVALQLIVYFGG